MRASGMLGNIMMVMACSILLTACDTSSTEATKNATTRRHSTTRAQPTPKPEVTSPASYKTCTEDFKLEVGTPRFDKCIASLSGLEAK